MKVGVLTYHCVPNFGAQLQAISTIGYLRKKGFEAVCLNWYAADLEEMYSRRIPECQVACHEKFTEESLPITTKVQNSTALISEIEKIELDAILVGSDALFKYIPLKDRRRFDIKHLRYYNNFVPLSCELLEDNPFFGSFLKFLNREIPGSVYAASSQNCPYKKLTYRERKEIKSSLSYYRKISVRDEWTKKMIEQITKRKNVPIYPDPVFSFNTNCYLSIPSKQEIIEKYNIPSNYLLLSFSGKHCDQNVVREIAKEAKKLNYTPVALPMPEKTFAPGITKKIELPLSPIDWYALIIHSAGYIGERMHPIVVCLHNSVPFFCFDEYGLFEEKGFFIRHMEYNPYSSKTYQIVADAKLQNNLFSYKGSTPMPSAQEVLGKIINFDKNQCTIFAQKKQQEYEQGMNDILKSLI